MHSDDDASLSSEPSHNQIHKVPCTLPYTAQILPVTTCPCVLWCCQSHGIMKVDAVPALQQSYCGVELTALLIATVTPSKTADNTQRLDRTSVTPPFKPYVWHLLGKCCCHKLDSLSLPSSQVNSMPVRTSQQQLQQQLQPIRTRSLASRQPLRGSPPPQQARASAPWQPWRMYQTRGLFNSA